MRNHVRVAYRELAPPRDLAHVIRCVWMRSDEEGDALVLPDGCVDVVVRAGQATVAGPDTGPVTVPLGPADVVSGVRFLPGAAAAALGVPADSLRDCRVALEDLWGPPGREAGEDPSALLAVLRRRLAEVEPDPRMLAAARWLAREPATPVPALAARVELGERQLRRRFAAAVGYGPKTFARIVRFRAALALLRAGEPPAAAAYEAGYADQAHMTREMGALAGLTPGTIAVAGRDPGAVEEV